MSILLQQLARRQLVWQGNSQQAAYQPLSSGFSELDQAIGGGFPATGLIDIQSETGIGELRLLLPYLIQQQAAGRLLVMINPPFTPCADMLAASGITLAQLVLINTKTAKDALWAAQQCLQSGCAAVVLLWPKAISLSQARRLQLASEQGKAALVLMRLACSSLSLPVNLSLQLQPHRKGLQIKPVKRKGGWPMSAFILDLQKHWPALTLADAASGVTRKAG